MALLTPLAPLPPGPLAAGTRMVLDAGGAESNVAICLAQAGRRVAWVSRLGADSLGRMVSGRVAGAGVDVSLVTIDPGAPTGLYLREPGRVWYYRAGSAASRLTSDIWAADALRHARIVYLTGITPALSASCYELVAGALTERPIAGARYVFDVNHRPALWPPGRAARVLADLARRADIVFVGRDEAAALWGTSSPGDVRALLAEPEVLVVKDAGTGATSYGRRGRAHVAALEVEVVDPVGAGDAFAAGYLHGLLGGADEPERLARGHRFAACVLCVAGDIADSARLAAAAAAVTPAAAVTSAAAGSPAAAGPPAAAAAVAAAEPAEERRPHRADI
jgi:2-dehydro-3-deoxygluconokinase